MVKCSFDAHVCNLSIKLCSFYIGMTHHLCQNFNGNSMIQAIDCKCMPGKVKR